MFRDKIKPVIFAVIIWQILIVSAFAQQTYFPTDVAWKNVKTDYGAVGDGVTDDTAAFQQALTTLLNPYNNRVSVYVPSGTYLVSEELAALSGFYDCCLTVQGENPNTTIIKLKDNAAGFQDSSNPRSVFKTRSGNQAFSMYFFNLTINTGNGNPGAVGLDYISSNYGAVKDVKIISPDGSGYSGIEMERQWAGPSLIKNVVIDNFKYGMRVATCEYSMTFEDITLNNQSVAGINNSCNTLTIRKLRSNNTVPAIVNDAGRVIIVDSQLNGGSSANQAINDSGFLFARNITSTGYSSVINNNGTPIPGSTVSEYYNNPDYSLFANDGKSLNLPIEETPEYVNNNPADWANVATYGARPTNASYETFDAAPGIQAALNSGKKIVYLGQIGDNNTRYCIYSDVIIPPTVEKIIGLSSSGFQSFNNSKFIINANSNAPLFIERLDGMDLLNNSSRTVVVKHSGVNYQNTAANTNGKVFLEDIGYPFRPTFPVRMWARQFNPEVQPEDDRDIDNPGGQYWILGLKTEGRANIARTTAGGSTEILGGLILPSSSFSGTTQQAFTVQNASMSIAGLTMTSYIDNGWYGIAVQETQNGETRTLQSSTIWANSPYNFSFYASLKKSSATGTGLRGEYYDNANFTNLKTARTDSTVNFDWGRENVPSGTSLTSPDTFSVRWTGEIEAPVTGAYTFTTRSDDGIRLWIGDQQIINNWTNHAPTDNSGRINLTAGQKYPIKLEYYENLGGAVAKLFWSYQGQAKQIIPQNRLYPGVNTSNQAADKMRFFPRAGFAYRMKGGKIQGSDDGINYVDLLTIVNTPTDGAWTELSFANSTSYRYLRYLSPNQGYGNIAELEFYAGAIKLSGTDFGTVGSWRNQGNTFEKALDGDTTTFFDAPNPGNGAFAGFDFGNLQ